MNEKTIEEMLKETEEMLIQMTVMIARTPAIEGRDEAIRAAQEMQKNHIEKTKLINELKMLITKDYLATKVLYTTQSIIDGFIDSGNEAT